MNPQAFIAQQTASPAPAPEASGPKGEQSSGPFGGMSSTLIMIVAVFAFMYFFAIRPQRKEEKKKKEMLAALKKGDTVITTGGIIGSVHSIKSDSDSIILKVGDNTRIEVLRSAIGSVRDQSASPANDDGSDKSEKTERFPKASKKSAKK
ncbi:MAG TPA: preprotein translocase subunit YajC [Leptospiraceae bacterium]|nr:preprotein translocase subunit YajC [Spirochaetaceae bacterium]HBS06678.1 preprotein translocase subunit YajC [Leptospiraceae bacterium]|tara:strand:+ start:126 stop:575 length:450 start_codon:yes stop_codon:yes gene_type:complete